MHESTNVVRTYRYTVEDLQKALLFGGTFDRLRCEYPQAGTLGSGELGHPVLVITTTEPHPEDHRHAEHGASVIRIEGNRLVPVHAHRDLMQPCGVCYAAAGVECFANAHYVATIKG